MRNIIRYRRRFIMTVLGVAGCAALMVTGFGIRDSVNSMVSLQFDEILQFDGTASLTKDTGETAAAALLELGRYSDAHAYLEEAFAIEKRQRPTADPDPRLYLTRARLHEKEGNPDLARIDLSVIRKAYPTLDNTAKAEFDALAQRVQFR